MYGWLKSLQLSALQERIHPPSKGGGGGFDVTRRYPIQAYHKGKRKQHGILANWWCVCVACVGGGREGAGSPSASGARGRHY